MFADYHMHTNHSNDSMIPMESVIIKAIQVGLDEICFTDHVDYGFIGKYEIDYDKYYQEFRTLKEKYKDQIALKFGCEFGVQIYTIPLYQRDFKRYEFDFIILSNHQIDGVEFWTGEFQENKTQEDYNLAYYQAIYDVMLAFDEYSVLGHLDMIKRYEKNGTYPDENLKEILTKILSHAIKHGKGIEVNTSCYRYRLEDITPSTYILKLYHELGGTILTIGSDSHKETDVGASIEETKDLLKELGFKTFCTFDKMIPIYHAL